MSEVEAEKWEGRVVLRLHESGLQSQWLLLHRFSLKNERPAQEDKYKKFPDRTRQTSPNPQHQKVFRLRSENLQPGRGRVYPSNTPPRPNTNKHESPATNTHHTARTYTT